MNNKRTILIADDNTLNIEFLSDVLGEEYNLLTAGGGWEALKIMREKEGDVDLLLLDVIMSDISGFEVIEQMKSDPVISSVPIVVISANDDERTHAEAMELGAEDFLSHDAGVDVIKEIVKKVLDKNEPSRLRREIKKIKADYEKQISELNTRLKRVHHLSELMNNLPGGAAVIKTDGVTAVCTYFNSETLRLFGMTSKQFSAQFLEDDPPYWLKSLISQADKADTFTDVFHIGGSVLNVKSDGQWIKAIAGTLSKEDGIYEIYSLFFDINSEKQQEQTAKEADKRLRDNEVQLDALINNAPGGIAYAEMGDDDHMHTLFVSKGLAEMLGYPDYETGVREISINPVVGISEEDIEEIDKLSDDALTDNMRIKYSFRRRTYDNRNIWLMMRGQLMYSDEGKLRLYAFVTNITKEKQIEKDLRMTAYYDPLTGLNNRTAFFKECQRILENDQGSEYSLMRINIGNFRIVNDLLGREVGDKVLKATARSICALIANQGVYGRFFADNFMIMTPYSERGVHPQMILDAIHKSISNIEEIQHELQFYIGIYNITDRSMSIDNMADRAAIACDSIKGSFREHIAYYDEKMRQQLIEEQDIMEECRRALDSGEFCVYYQPVYGIRQSKFVSAEALVRWEHPVKGVILPRKFVPVFEKNGFIADLDLFVLEQVCKYQKKRLDNKQLIMPISVNLSKISLYNPHLDDEICGIVDKYGIESEYIRFEITESAYNYNPSNLLVIIGKLRNRGFRMVMDDYGKSSLITLKDMPVDILKLDMKSLTDFESNTKVGVIVTSIVRMAKWLNIPMVAECVETSEQFDFLKSIDCSYIQGFCIAHPLPEDEFSELVDDTSIAEDSTEPKFLDTFNNINDLLGGNELVSRLMESVFGGLGIYEKNDKGIELIRMNEGYKKMMGYTDETEVKGALSLDVLKNTYPDDVKKCRDAFEKSAETGKAVTVVFRRYDAKGKLLTLEGTHTMIGGTKKNPLFCVAFNNLTEKLESDKIIESTQKQINEILNTTEAAVVDINFETGSFYQAGNLDEYGFDLKLLSDHLKSNNPFSDTVHPDDYERAESFHKDIVEGRKSDEFRIHNNKDGKYYWWRFTIIRWLDDNGKVTRMIGIANNIDAERRAELALNDDRKRVDIAMSRLKAGFLVAEVRGENSAHILFVNSSFWKVIGQSPVDDKDFFNQVNNGVDPKTLNRLVDEVKSKGKVSLQYPAVRDDGKRVWIEFNCSRTGFDDKNKHRIYTIIVQDVTEQHENKAKLDAIVNNFEGGLALVDTTNGTTKIIFTNELFYDILCVPGGSEKRLASMIETIMKSGCGTGDLRIRCADGSRRIVRMHLVKIDNHHEMLVIVNDVTKKRAEAKDRIAERMANASCGLYDEVYEINYVNDTVKFTSSRRSRESAVAVKPVTIEQLTGEWVDRRVQINDRKKAKELLMAPIGNTDFTDAYVELRMSDNIAGEYHTYGMVLVRSKSDACMLFIRDKTRFDSSVISAQVAEMNRLYRQVAEQTNTTVFEVDHVTKRVAYTPTIDMYWASRLSDRELVEFDEYKKGLIVYKEDFPIFSKFLSDIARPNALGPFETTIRLKMYDGSYKWCKLSTSFTRNKNGKIQKSISTLNVVHDEVVARKKAEQTDELLRRTVRHIPVGVGIFRCEANDVVPIYLSDNIYLMYGIKNGRIGTADLPLSELAAKAGEGSGSEGDFSYESTRADGSKFWVNTQYRVLNENGDTIIYAALSDISEKIETQLNERVKEQMYQVLLEETGTIIFDYKPDKDVMSYMWHPEHQEQQPVYIENAVNSPDGLTFINVNDRMKFALMLKNLSQEAGAEEMVLKAGVSEKSVRHKVFMKSVVDEKGKIFEIIGKLENMDESAARLERIQAKAMYDPLCVDLYNKATTQELISFELEKSKTGALLMIDVDDFKSINDHFGHVFGDEFLKKFGSTIRGAFRDTDIVGRYGGDEFIVFMPNTTSKFALKKAHDILKKVSEIEVPMNGGVKSSIGLASVNVDNRQYKMLLKQADTALYKAKNLGKNCVVKYDPLEGNDDNYRVETASDDRNGIVLSSNPTSSAGIIMRVFSCLYSGSDLNSGISRVLELVGKNYDVSRVYIFEDFDDGRYCRNTFEWCEEGVEPMKDMLQNVSYEKDLGGNYRDNMNDDGIFYCHDISSLSKPQYEILARQGIKSVLQCSIMDNGSFKGFVGFDECRSSRFWTQEQIDALVFLSKVFSIFLIKDREKTKSENYAASLRSVLDSHSNYMCVIDYETHEVLYLNKRAEEMMSGSHSENLSLLFPGLKLMPGSAPTHDGLIDTRNIRSEASEIDWNGKKAYLLFRAIIED